MLRSSLCSTVFLGRLDNFLVEELVCRIKQPHLAHNQELVWLPQDLIPSSTPKILIYHGQFGTLNGWMLFRNPCGLKRENPKL